MYSRRNKIWTVSGKIILEQQKTSNVLRKKFNIGVKIIYSDTPHFSCHFSQLLSMDFSWLLKSFFRLV
jgi:hypothetical protein